MLIYFFNSTIMCITFSFVEVAAHHTMNISAALSASEKVSIVCTVNVRLYSLFIQLLSIGILCGDRLLYKTTINHLRLIFNLLMKCSRFMEMVQCIGL